MAARKNMKHKRAEKNERKRAITENFGKGNRKKKTNKQQEKQKSKFWLMRMHQIKEEYKSKNRRNVG